MISFTDLRPFYALLIIISMLFSGITILNPSKVSGEEVSGSIVISSDGDLGSSQYVSGSGTSTDPYTISNYTMKNGSIRVSYTTDYLHIRDIEFPSNSSLASSDWAIDLLDVRDVTVSDIRCDNWTKFIRIRSSNNVLVEDSDVTIPGSSGNSVSV